MARRADSSKKSKSKVSRAVTTLEKTAKKLAARLKPKRSGEPATQRTQQSAKPRVQPTTQRKKRPQTDIPLDALNGTYIPPQTSLKASFRTDGADRQRDQEFAGAADRWNDEDRLTNKSGDPRIGTHGRQYEAAESRLGKKGRS